MLQAVIVDNEIPFIKSLQKALGLYCPEVIVTGTWNNVKDAVAGIREKQPDIVFLDVELDHGALGFEVLEKIPERNFEVVFVTAHNKYAVLAFRFCAIDFIEKPLDADILKEAVARVKNKRSQNEFKMQWQVLHESIKNLSSLPKQIILPNPKQGDSIVVSINDVIRIESGNSQCVFTVRWNGKIEKTMYSMSIGAVHKKLLHGYDDFIMIHESHIINRHHITHYNAKSHAVKMADDTFIRIADRRINEFLQKFNRI